MTQFEKKQTYCYHNHIFVSESQNCHQCLLTLNVWSRAGKVRFSGAQNSMFLKASSGECCKPCNIVLLVTLQCTCSPHHPPIEISYGEMNQGNNILQFPHIRAKWLSAKRKSRL